MTTTFATLLALLIIPVLFLAWVFETQPERIHRLHCSGWSQRQIANHLGITRHRVRCALA